MNRAFFVALFALAAMPVAPAAGALDVPIGYLGRTERTETISLVEQPAANDGIAGAQLAIEDNNTTGKFLNQSFSIEATRLKAQDDAVTAAMQFADRGISLLIADLPGRCLLKVADAGRERGLFFFNAGASDDRLRQEDCRADVIHVAPSRSMLADGLAQYLVWKRWRRWLLVVGSHDPDQLYAAAFRRAAGRFGAKIVQERVFEDTGGARRSDSGLVQIQSQIPSSLSRHPITTCWSRPTKVRSLRHISRTGPAIRGRLRLGRPCSHELGRLARSMGRDPAARSLRRSFSRRMTALDMQAWTAVRMIGEAASVCIRPTPKEYSTLSKARILRWPLSKAAS